MKKRFFFRRAPLLLAFSAVLLMLFSLCPTAYAADFSLSPHAGALKDGKESSYATVSELTVSGKDLTSVYILFDTPVGAFELSDSEGQRVLVNENDFLHLFLDLTSLFGKKQDRVTLHLDKKKVSEIKAFGDEPIPDTVQRWEPSHQKADLMLFGAHSDDEHLFFAGIVPLYAGQRGLDVQVVYLTHNWDTHTRPHELLNGLWTAGMRHYPVIGPFPDLYSTSLDGANSVYKNAGYTEEDFLAFEVEMLRRFKPAVLVTHDVNGEYGHGTHRLLAHTIPTAIKMAADTELFPDSEVRYGIWEPFKVYLHLWEDNPIVLDLDEPLSAFGGRTAFDMAKEGYACHHSQQWTWFTRWVNVPTASDIKTYSPKQFGLFFRTVGEDVGKNDFFENLTSNDEYAEIERLSESLSPAEEAERPTGTSPAESLPGESGTTANGTEHPSRTPLEPSCFGDEPQSGSNSRHLWLILLSLTAAAIVLLILLAIQIRIINRKKRRTRHEP